MSAELLGTFFYEVVRIIRIEVIVVYLQELRWERDIDKKKIHLWKGLGETMLFANDRRESHVSFRS